MIPFAVDRPLRNPPAVTTALVVVNVVVAVLLTALPQWREQAMEWGALDPRQLRLHQFLSFLFLHADGIWHIAGNMLFLWVFGGSVEDRLGRVGFLAFYLGGGVASGLGHALLDQAPAIGASGAVASVTGAFLILFPGTRVKVLWLLAIITVFEIPSLWFVGLSFLRDLFGHLSGAGDIAYMAHISGTLFGVASVSLLLMIRWLPREPYDLVSMISQANRRRRFRAITERGYNPWEGTRPKTPIPAMRPAPTGSSSGASEQAGADNDVAQQEQAESRQRVSQLVDQGQLKAAAEEFERLRRAHPQTVLGSAVQVALANYFFSQQRYELAAEMYRRFLDRYGTSADNGQVRLMLGLTLVRYLGRPTEAIPHLEGARERLDPGRDREMAEELLEEAQEAAEGGREG